MTNTTLKFEINSLPKSLRDEVAAFIRDLKKRSKGTKQVKNREFGYFKGKVKLSSDFDTPLDEFKEYI